MIGIGRLLYDSITRNPDEWKASYSGISSLRYLVNKKTRTGFVTVSTKKGKTRVVVNKVHVVAKNGLVTTETVRLNFIERLYTKAAFMKYHMYYEKKKKEEERQTKENVKLGLLKAFEFYEEELKQ